MEPTFTWKKQKFVGQYSKKKDFIGQPIVGCPAHLPTDFNKRLIDGSLKMNCWPIFSLLSQVTNTSRCVRQEAFLRVFNQTRNFGNLWPHCLSSSIFLMPLLSLASSSSFKRWKYDVFFSFRSEDTCKKFIGHLYIGKNWPLSFLKKQFSILPSFPN